MEWGHGEYSLGALAGWKDWNIGNELNGGLEWQNPQAARTLVAALGQMQSRCLTDAA